MRLLQILPRVPPAVCGVADYAWNLAEALQDRHGIHSTFLSAGTSWVQPLPPTKHPVHRLEELTREALLSWVVNKSNDFDAMLLHLSPYGYHKRAIPFWLASSWRSLAKKREIPPSLTFFHELYASGPPTTSAFWLQPLQKRILRRIKSFSTATMTNRLAYAQWLDQKPNRRYQETETIPVFSNLGEQNEFTPFKQRQSEALFFTAANHCPGPTERILEQALLWAQRLGIQKVHLVGRVPTEFQNRRLEVAVQFHGYLSQADVMALLSRCQVGFSAYTASHLSKSGLLAAMASFGLAVVVYQGHKKLSDGLLENENLLCADSPHNPMVWTTEGLENLGRNLHKWYRFHSIAYTADRYAAAFARLTYPHV
jgi:hypothetical protein